MAMILYAENAHPIMLRDSAEWKPLESNKHSCSRVWVDEAPDIGNGIAGVLLPNDAVSYFSYAAPRLSFLAKCVRQQFDAERYQQHLFQEWPCPASADITTMGLCTLSQS